MPIYAINWMDVDIKAKMWLQKYGNPFKMILQDNKSKLALPLGVTATPESFVVTPTGEIIMHIRGVITPEIMKEINKTMKNRITQDYGSKHSAGWGFKIVVKDK